MAKVAKKSASSSKKSVASAKPAAKKADKQKKTTVKATPTASKKKAAPAPKAAVKKPAPVKPVAKKAAAKKPSKPVAAVKKAPAKAAKVVASKKVAPKAKVAAKKPVAKAEPKPVAKAAPSSKKIAVPAKGKAVVAKAAPAKPEKAVPQKTKPAEVKKAPAAPAPPTIPVAKAAAAVAGKPRRKKKKNDDDDDDEEVVVFRKPAKKVSSAVKKSSSKYISEELTMEGPAPKRIGQITMTSDEKIKLKKALLNKCIDIQKNTVSIAKKAMEDALTSANAEKVTEELSDSFRESMHATRDMYARQANEGVNNLGLLNRINIVEHEKVKFGSVVFTNFQNYFISTGLGEIKIDDLSFQAVSTLAPLFQILVDKKKGDTFMFLDRLYTVIEVF